MPAPDLSKKSEKKAPEVKKPEVKAPEKDLKKVVDDVIVERTKESVKVSPVLTEEPELPKEKKEPEPSEEKKSVRSVLSLKIVLVNPFTKVRAIPHEVVPNVVVDSWWNSQVKAGLAKWV